MKPEDALVPLAEKILEQAKAGDIASFKEIADRLDGKPSQQLQVGGDGQEPVNVSLSWLTGRNLGRSG